MTPEARLATPAHLMEQHLTRLVRTLCGDRKLAVRFSGAEYSCTHAEGQYQLTFAALPERVPPDFARALEGFADHECAHVLFTRFEVMSYFSLIESQTETLRLKALLNVLEDVRIEQAMGLRFPGSAANLKQMNQWQLSQMFDALSLSSWDQVLLVLLLLLADLPVFDTLQPLAAWLQKAHGDLLPPSRALKSTAAALHMARIWLERLQETGPPATVMPDPSDSAPPVDLKQTLPKHLGSRWREQQLQQQHQAAEAWARSQTSNPAHQSERALAGRSLRLQNPAQARLRLSRQLETPLQVRLPAPFSREWDRVVREHPASPVGEVTDSELHFCSLRLLRWLTRPRPARCEKGQTHGRVLASQLYRSQSDQKIFGRRRLPVARKDTVFCVGVDNSASMDRARTQQILQTVFALLTRLPVPFCVFAYTTENERICQQYPDALENPRFTRLTPVRFDLLKDFQAPAQRMRHYLEPGPQGMTPTPEAFEFALNILKKRPEQQKIFLHITDGLPHTPCRDSESLLGVVAGLMQAMAAEGVGVINLGYQVSERFRALDPDAILTGEGQFLADLVTLLLQQLRPTHTAGQKGYSHV